MPRLDTRDRTAGLRARERRIRFVNLELSESEAQATVGVLYIAADNARRAVNANVLRGLDESDPEYRTALAHRDAVTAAYLAIVDALRATRED